jgi:hypothetical protein
MPLGQLAWITSAVWSALLWGVSMFVFQERVVSFVSSLLHLPHRELRGVFSYVEETAEFLLGISGFFGMAIGGLLVLPTTAALVSTAILARAHHRIALGSNAPEAMES